MILDPNRCDIGTFSAFSAPKPTNLIGTPEIRWNWGRSADRSVGCAPFGEDRGHEGRKWQLHSLPHAMHANLIKR